MAEKIVKNHQLIKPCMGETFVAHWYPDETLKG
jgi:hypothetical protein